MGRSRDEPAGGDADPIGRCLVRARSDPAAFGEFYEATHRQVLGYFVNRTACAATAADLCAETYAGALASVHRYDPAQGSGRAWLSGIYRHVLQQYLHKERISRRMRARLGIRFEAVEEVDLARIEELVDRRPLVAHLTASLHSLPADSRQAVVLRIVDGLSYEAIAARLGCTVGHARVRVCRGLDRLETLLSDR